MRQRLIRDGEKIRIQRAILFVYLAEWRSGCVCVRTHMAYFTDKKWIESHQSSLSPSAMISAAAPLAACIYKRVLQLASGVMAKILSAPQRTQNWATAGKQILLIHFQYVFSHAQGFLFHGSRCKNLSSQIKII